MKKQKLKLNEVNVQSFVTRMEDAQKGVQGGRYSDAQGCTDIEVCYSRPPYCYMSGVPCTQAAYCTQPV